MRCNRKLPNSIKNPRKLKKEWKKKAVANLLDMSGRNGVNCRWKLRWVPGDGWTVWVIKKHRV